MMSSRLLGGKQAQVGGEGADRLAVGQEAAQDAAQEAEEAKAEDKPSA